MSTTCFRRESDKASHGHTTVTRRHVNKQPSTVPEVNTLVQECVCVCLCVCVRVSVCVCVM